ncbi:MAG: metalloregulator ArsR/SmtB family transcription factor [Candidatus ainarchaeum sp.]|nr:metalloregulator ArsR/SmtB family transcription factor [Candidatus ainarchaeum sp.]
MGANVIRAIADRTRLRLLERIGRREICACKLPRFVGTSQPAVSQHLKILLGARLVKMRKQGTKRLYSVSEKGSRVLRDISGW